MARYWVEGARRIDGTPWTGEFDAANETDLYARASSQGVLVSRVVPLKGAPVEPRWSEVRSAPETQPPRSQSDEIALGIVKGVFLLVVILVGLGIAVAFLAGVAGSENGAAVAAIVLALLGIGAVAVYLGQPRR